MNYFYRLQVILKLKDEKMEYEVLGYFKFWLSFLSAHIKQFTGVKTELKV